MRRKINRKTSSYYQLQELFGECLRFYETFLFKSQQIAQHEGLNGSLLFELLK